MMNCLSCTAGVIPKFRSVRPPLGPPVAIAQRSVEPCLDVDVAHGVVMSYREHETTRRGRSARSQ